MERPIVLCGLGRMGARVLSYLHAANLPVVIIDTCCKPDDPQLKGARLVSGDCRRRDILEAAGVADARGVLILTGDDLLNVSTALAVRSLNADVRIVLRMFNQDLIGRLGNAVHNVFALSTSLLTAPVLAVTALTGQGLGAFRLEGVEDGRRQVAEVRVVAQSALRERVLASVSAERGIVVLGHFSAGGAARFLLDVDPEVRLQTGDALLVCGEPHSINALLAEAGSGEVPRLLWAGWGRRMGRVAWHTLNELDKAVLVCTALLVLVVAISMMVFHFGVEKYTWADSLYQTISVMATGARMPKDDFPESNTMKVFVSVLRVFGMALLAAFTAILTNYLLRARLGGAFEVRRIPDGGHVIVCGLGPIGYRVVEELTGSGEQVVVIERDPDNRFLSTARRRGAAVILGDAGVKEVLRQAHAGTAYAILATTNNDLTNLAVALLAREENPKQRVVLLLSDPQLAQMLRQAANVRLAFSVPMLAAPAFLAGLYGDRVLSVLQLRERLFAVIDLLIQPKDHLAGQPVRAVAVDYALQPVALVPAQGVPSRTPLTARLAVGDRLVAVVAFADLERLLHRHPVPAACAVEVVSLPLPARGWLAGLVRTLRGVDGDEAVRIVESVPFRLAEGLTRGQAEELLAHLVRERITAKLSSATGTEGRPT